MLDPRFEPTTADYAASAAYDNKGKVEKLQEEVAYLQISVLFLAGLLEDMMDASFVRTAYAPAHHAEILQRLADIKEKVVPSR